MFRNDTHIAPSSPSKGKIDVKYSERLFSPRRGSRSRGFSLTPASSPSSASKKLSPGKRRRRSQSATSTPSSCYGDRFIPSRSGSFLDFGFSSVLSPNRSNRVSNSRTGRNESSGNNTTGSGNDAASTNSNGGESKDSVPNATYNMLLQNEVLGIDSSNVLASPGILQNENAGISVSRGRSLSAVVGGSSGGHHRSRRSSGSARRRSASVSSGRGPCSPISMLRFKTEKTIRGEDHFRTAFSLSPLSAASRKLMSRPVKLKRKIAKVPFKVLDAPALQDDFYLNLVDWSSQNVLAVGLGSCVYLWSACTSKVTKLCDLGPDDLITSVSWSQRGSVMSVGTNRGDVQLWDTTACKMTRNMSGHSARVGTMAWNSNILATGSRDRYIFQRDVRTSHATATVRKLTGHKQEVCGLKWSFDDQQLASGGNDNKLFIWDASRTSPLLRFTDHTAAVKAIAWSPHQQGLLASGGGTADRRIRFWNTMTGASLNCIDTDSQVCNLMWSKNVNEIVSTHGYSLNQIIVWRYPSMAKVATLTGHTYRVLYLAMSPDGQTIVTGAGDETLRFWNVFPGPKHKDGSDVGSSLLFPVGRDIR